jgi:3'5'-cyclic nucleotide phosphodiesterase
LNINTQVFSNFINSIQDSYRQNPYHNVLHAFDVMQTTNFFYKKLGFSSKAELSSLELCTGYVAAACHDVDHRGYNN